MQQIGLWRIEEICSRSDAVKYGSDRGWCTANDMTSFDRSYNKDRGDLFILFKDAKKRAHSQIFFSKNGPVEFRKPFNQYIDTNAFFSAMGEGHELIDWYEENKYEMNPNVLGGQVGLANVVPAGSNTITSINTDIGIANDNLLQVDMTANNLQLTDRRDELPTDVPAGTMMFVNETNSIHIYDGTDWQEAITDSVEQRVDSIQNLACHDGSTLIIPHEVEVNVTLRMDPALYRILSETVR